MCETRIAEGVFQWSAPDTRWLSTGWNGGFRDADAAYNVSVPTGWACEDVGAYVDDRLGRAEFTTGGPVLLTGVDLDHARGARMDSVVVYATVGLSNPAVLPASGESDRPEAIRDRFESDGDTQLGDGPPEPGTVNLLVRTTRSLTDGALATLVATAVEAKTATLRSLTGFTGTTSDAVVAGAAETGEPVRWAGSGTEVGNAARVCVRDAVRASFRSRYATATVPNGVAAADHGVVTGGDAEVFSP